MSYFGGTYAYDALSGVDRDKHYECTSHHIMGFSSFLFLCYFGFFRGLLYEQLWFNKKAFYELILSVYLVGQTLFCGIAAVKCEYEPVANQYIWSFFQSLLANANNVSILCLSVYLIMTVRREYPYSSWQVILLWNVMFFICAFFVIITVSIPAIIHLIDIPRIVLGPVALLMESYSFYAVYKYTLRQRKIILLTSLVVFLSIPCYIAIGLLSII